MERRKGGRKEEMKGKGKKEQRLRSNEIWDGGRRKADTEKIKIETVKRQAEKQERKKARKKQCLVVSLLLYICVMQYYCNALKPGKGKCIQNRRKNCSLRLLCRKANIFSTTEKDESWAFSSLSLKYSHSH